MDSPLQVTMWSKRVRAVDFTIGYEVRSVRAPADSKPSVIAETQLAAVHIKEQRLQRLSAAQQRVSAALDAMTQSERGIWLEDATHREDLATFVERAVRLDDAAVIRLRERPGGLVVAWVATGFDVLASRVVAGRSDRRPECRRRRARRRGLTAMDRSGSRRPGLSDGLGVARCAAARHGLRAHRRRARAGGARPGAARRRAGEGARQLARSAGVAAGPGGARGQLRARATSASRCAAYSP